jgi:hypothetical protein
MVPAKKRSSMAVAARLPIDRVLERAHDHVYKGFETHAALVKELTHALGRPTVARFTGVPDLKTVTRWSLGRNQPSDDRLELLRNAAVFYFALLELGLTPTNAEQWFRGANPALGFEMPVDVLHQRRYAEVEASTNSGGSAITPTRFPYPSSIRAMGGSTIRNASAPFSMDRTPSSRASLRSRCRGTCTPMPRTFSEWRRRSATSILNSCRRSSTTPNAHAIARGYRKSRHEWANMG